MPTPGSQEDGAVLPPAQEDLDEPVELLRPAGDGVIAPAACLLDHIQGVLVQQPGGGGGRSAVALPPVPGGVAPAAQGPGGLAGKVVQLDPCRCQQAAGAPVFLPQQAQEQWRLFTWR
ncbi:MAG: hypothetical protein ACLR6W_08715 [Evtepia sp.]